ncbi:MAG: DUF6659 family protein [Candidatus Nitrosopumilus sp. bin_7KS]
MTVNYNELSKQVLKLDDKIRFAAVANSKGELVAGGYKENIEKIFGEDEAKMSMHYALQKRDLNTNLAYKIGLEKASITDFEKVSMISIPINSNELFLIRTEPNVDHCKILNFVYSALDSKSGIKEEIKKIQTEIAELKKMEKKKIVKRKPARKSAAKKKVVKRKPARKAVKRKTARRK